MKKIVSAFFCLVITPFCFSNVVHIVETDSTLLGADNVLVDGVYYDVRFRDGTFAEIFELNSLIANSKNQADLFSEALNDQVFLNLDDQKLFDSMPNLTEGCNEFNVVVEECIVFTPFGSASAEDVAAEVAGGNLEIGWIFSSQFNNLNGSLVDKYGSVWAAAGDPDLFTTTNSNELVWAQWSLAQSAAIPLPAAAWLYLSCLLSFSVTRKFKRLKNYSVLYAHD